MKSVKELFNERKSSIIEVLTRSKTYYDAYDQPDKAKAFEILISNVKSGEFSIVVVGEFSSGKSTFLNALMHDKYLPSFSNETTATINYLRHSTKGPSGIKGQVFYENDNIENLDSIEFDKIEKFVSTKSTIKVAKDISHLDLYLDSKFLEDGVILVDSPGLNGVADHHRERTERQINQSHASIFIFSAEQPGRKTDFEFLKELKKKMNTIIFVLNKIDCINTLEQPLESVINKLKESYHCVFPEEETIPEIWPIAAYPALIARASTKLEYHQRTDFSNEEKEHFEKMSQMEAFEERIWKFLTQSEKTRGQLLAPVEKVISLLKIEKDELEQESSVLSGTKDTDDINDKIAEIRDKLNALDAEKKNIAIEISNKLKEIERDVREKAEASFEKLRKDRIRLLSEWDNLDDLNEATQNLEQSVEKQTKIIGRECADMFHEMLTDLITIQYSQLRGSLDLLPNSSIDLHISSRIELSNKDINFGIEEYNKKIGEKEREIEQLQESLDQAELSVLDAMKKESLLKQRQVELKEAKDRKELFESQISVPSVDYKQQQVTDKVYVDGIISSVWHFIFGPKRVTRTETIADTSERDEYKKRVEAKQESYDKEISELTRQYEEAKGSAKSSDELELMKKQIDRKLAEKQERLAEERKQFRESYMKKYEKQLNSIRRQIEEYIDSVNDTLSKEFRKELRNRRDTVAGAMTDLITSNLEKQMTQENERLQMLSGQLESSEYEKNNRLQMLKQRLDEVDKILSSAVELECDIENMTVDEIKQERL